MSKIMESQTQFNDLDILCESARHHGFDVKTVEGFSLVSLEGYGGETFQAQIGITKDNFRTVTGIYTYGDLGFLQGQDGCVTLIADDMLLASARFTAFYDGFKMTYAEKKYVKEIAQQGFTVSTRTVSPEGEVSLEFTEMCTLG